MVMRQTGRAALSHLNLIFENVTKRYKCIANQMVEGRIIFEMNQMTCNKVLETMMVAQSVGLLRNQAIHYFAHKSSLKMNAIINRSFDK
jgi:hypothetical protein